MAPVCSKRLLLEEEEKEDELMLAVAVAATAMHKEKRQRSSYENERDTEHTTVLFYESALDSDSFINISNWQEKSMRRFCILYVSASWKFARRIAPWSENYFYTYTCGQDTWRQPN